MPNPINPLYPVTEVGSVEELMDIAASMEAEAERRFEELAALMDRADNDETAELFRQLAEDERVHEGAIEQWAAREQLRAPRHVSFQWRMPETFDLEGTDGGAFLTPYEALGLALANEERAFSFYTYLAAIADNDEARQRAEALARGELEHVSRLRYRMLEMRRERGRPEPARVESPADLQALAGGLERTCAELAAAGAHLAAENGDAASSDVLARVADGARRQAERLDAPSASSTPPGDVESSAAAGAGPEHADIAAVVRFNLRQAEDVLRTYLDVAGRTGDEAVLHEAQALAQHALARVSLLSARAGDLA